MLFHKLSDQENIPLKLPLLQLNGNITKGENSLKLLGVILDELLTWKNTYNLLKIRSQKYWRSLSTLTSTMQILHGLALVKLN